MKKILVLEDDQDIGEIVEIALSDKYKTMVKRNDENLLGQLDQFQPDLLLIDNSLGHVKAADVMESIKSDDKFKRLPFILFSAHHDLKNLASELGAAAYLPKPFGLDELHQCIDEVLNTTD